MFPLPYKYDCHHRILACLRGRLPPPDLPFLRFSGCSPEGTFTMEVLDGKEANHREGTSFSC